MDATPDHSSPCPDETVLAAYIDGQLGAGSREEVEAHLAECEDCAEIFTETARMDSATSGVPLWLVVALITALLSIVLWRMLGH